MNNYILKKYETVEQLEYPVSSNQILTVGSGFEFDIFLYSEIPDQHYFDFQIIEGHPQFTMINDSIINNNGDVIVLDQLYNSPFYFSYQEIKLALGEKNELEEQWLGLTTSNEIENLFDNSAADETPEGFDYQTFDDKINKVKLKSAKFNKFIGDSNKFINLIIKKIKYLFNLSPKIFLTAMVISFMIIISVIAGISYNHTNQQTLIHLQQLQKDRELKKLFIHLPEQYNNLNLLGSADHYVLSGLITKPQDQIFLKKYFQAYGSKIKFDLTYATFAITQINALIKNYDFGGKVIAQYDSDNQQIKLIGLVLNLNQINNLEIEISNKLPIAKAINIVQVYEINQVNNDFQNVIASYESAGLIVDTHLDNWKISLHGYLSNSAKQNLLISLVQFNKKYPILTINVDIKDVTTALPFRITSVYNGNPSYIETDNGTILFVNGVLDGMRLLAIDNHKIIFTNGKFPLVMSLDPVIP